MKAIEKYLHNYLACVCMLCMLNEGLFLNPQSQDRQGCRKQVEEREQNLMCAEVNGVLQKNNLKCVFKRSWMCKDSRPGGGGQQVHSGNMGHDREGSMERIVEEAVKWVDRAGNTGRAEGGIMTGVRAMRKMMMNTFSVWTVMKPESQWLRAKQPRQQLLDSAAPGQDALDCA